MQSANLLIKILSIQLKAYNMLLLIQKINCKHFIKDNNYKNKLQIIRFAAPENFRKFEWHEKIMIKAMQADNNDYFLSILNDDDEDNFTFLLHAFSKFKKWQQSSMKLLLLPKYEAFDKKIFEKLKTYKYREDVRLLENLEGNAACFSCCIGTFFYTYFICFCRFDGFIYCIKMCVADYYR